MKRIYKAADWMATRLRAFATADNDQKIQDDESVYLPDLSQRLSSVPGMLSDRSGEVLYLLAASQTLTGNIVEIGSWQGKSTCFLAHAAKATNNGLVHAIDHFEGGALKEAYIVEEGDLSDLERNFRKNIQDQGVEDVVRVHAMSSD